MRALAVIAIVVLLALGGLAAYVQPRVGDIVETLEAENATLKIRIENREETCKWFCLPGAYYVFLSSPQGVDRWREIMTFRHDDPGPIPRNNIRFVSEKTAFVFMGWMFGVTTDNGETWVVWSAQDDLPKWACCNYRLIREVHVSPDGTGVMTLSTIPERQGEVPALRTIDFGKHWSQSAD